ncbi:hypothetical protein NQZ68_039164 [Dissostichus eleginoides]|nr:hypothetical protein NQZ68_039164 [Dissostichus eleginoides]
MELPLGRFSPQMGTAGGDPPPRAEVTPPFSTQLPPPPPLLLPPSPAVPLLLSAHSWQKGSADDHWSKGVAPLWKCAVHLEQRSSREEEMLLGDKLSRAGHCGALCSRSLL